jgi:uncharacterized protein YhbP (UPF0306 family)
MAMTNDRDFAATARLIIDNNLYMVLGTADASGRPWVSPVYYAPAAYKEFFWVSRHQAMHSRNLTARPEVSIVVFDSSVPIGTGKGVYMSAAGQMVTGDEREEGIQLFSRRSVRHGGREWTLEDVESPASLRLYRATVVDLYVLDEHDERVHVKGL